MKKSAYIFLAAAALFAASCESKIQPDEEFDGEAAVCFMPMLDDASTVMPDTDPTSGSNAVMPDTNPASRTKATDLVSADGSISLALGYEVCDGIAGQEIAGLARNDDKGARNDEKGGRNDGDERNDEGRHAELDSASPETKGTQLNTTGSDAALGNYSISSFKVAAWKGSGALIPANTVVTKGTTVWTTSTSYLWGASQEATFYAYANLPSSGAAVICTSSASQTLAYTALPKTAAAQSDILLGFYKGKGRYDATLHKGGIADIKFYHPMSAVQFKLEPGAIDGATTVSVKKISISKVHAGGTAVMTPPATGSTVPGITWTPLTYAGTTTVTLGDGTSDLTIDSSSDYLIGEPFILIPQVLTSSPVTVTVELSIDGTATTLAAKINTGEWKAGKTNIYTLGYDSKSFTLSGPGDFNFFNTAATSDDSQTIDCYVKDGTAGTQTAGDYYLEYSTDGGESYSSTSPDWVTVSVGNGTNGEDRTLTVGVTELTAYTETGVAAALQSYPEKTNFDLSKFNSATGQACETSTANTYIVNAPGTYRFPVVYGNALKNGTTNSAAYHPQTGSNPTTMNASGSNGYNYYLRYFLDYEDQTITQPYILHSKTGQYTVGTLWSDIQNLVTNVALEGSGDDAYISFTVAKSTINEGNAVIYLADPSGDIVWSWQIWVSAVDASKTIPIKNLAGVSHDFMTYHLGWESSVNAVIKLPTPRTVKVRMVMTYDGNVKDSKEFNVTQSGIGSYKDPTDGRCTYYQWGRKDPFIPGGCRTVYNIKSGVSPLVSTTFNSNTFQSIPVQHATQSQQGVTIGATIQHPWIHYCSYWMAPTKYDITNLWNGNVTSRNYTGETLKTVYDPSPVGFVVPPSDAYTAFTVDGLSNNDDTTKINADMTAGFDPASATGTGWRFYTQGWKTGPTVSFTIKGNRFSQDGIWANTIGADKTTTEDQGRLWTSGPTTVSGSSNVVAIGLIYHHTWVKPKQTLDEADGTCIRCVKETL